MATRSKNAELEARVKSQKRQLDIATAALTWIIRQQPRGNGDGTWNNLGIVKAFKASKLKAIETLNRMYPEGSDVMDSE